MDAESARVMNASIIGIALIGSLLTLVYASRADSAYRRLARWAERTGLPLIDETDALWPPVAARFRRTGIAEAVGLIAGTLVSAVFLLTPLAGDPAFIIIVFLPAIVVTSLPATVGVGLRENLFSPPPDAPRLARARVLRTVDYLGGVRVALPWALALAGATLLIALATTWTRMPAQVDPDMGRAAFVIGALAVILSVALPRIDRAILARPQPASTALQLAWDDALRSGTLASLRLTVAMSWLAVILFASQAMWGAALQAAGLVPPMSVAGLALVSLNPVYPGNGFALRPALRPHPSRAATA